MPGWTSTSTCKGDGLVPGPNLTNTLEFRVYNESGPSGLLVANLEATVVPEPSTFVAGMLLLTAFSLHGRRKKGVGNLGTDCAQLQKPSVLRVLCVRISGENRIIASGAGPLRGFPRSK